MHTIVLASSSKYRKALFERLRLPFDIFSPEINETPRQGESPQALVLRLSREKAACAAVTFPHAVCIGSDEVATLGDKILGKPGNHENAVAQLKQMSAQRVEFHTGVSIVSQNNQLEDTRLVTTAVKFRTLTETMIQHYLEKEKPYSSAGSFKSETLGSALIERFEGDDPSAMIGLPLIALCDMLKIANINVI